tara:strand:+ start:2554 stop:2952 length:399 start_codon:yes stop_codon:yes gene_type:complete
MKIKDTLKAWSDAEINLVTKDSSAFDYNDRWIIRWYFFGSCDICTQAMELSDNDFQYFYRETLRHIGIPNDEIEESIGIWMLDKINQNEMVIIERGALNFRQFKDNPNGVGGLKECFIKFSKHYNKDSAIES